MSSDHIYSHIEFPENFELRSEALDELQRGINEASVDIREALRTFLPSADPYQNRIIEAVDSTIRLVAPAGSGKTQTIINRVLTRIKNGVNPKRILVLTFDNAAASSLRNKLADQLLQYPAQLDGLKISTLNAFGWGLLREYFTEEHKTIVPEHRQRSIIREGLEELRRRGPEQYAVLPANVERRFYRDLYSLLKNQIFDPRDINPQHLADFITTTLRKEIKDLLLSHLGGDATSIKKVIQALYWLFKAYESALQQDRCMDFDDQKLRALRSLQKSPQLLSGIHGQFTEIIVDEFQDINKLDFMLIKCLAEKATLVVTGDDDQAV
ncbi:MAG: UvrD-helicase domain-containing protein [Nitrospirota bacterium]|nr:UvrD-helicase domain-containing protein [Nitrospirota bacterium]